jgi:hypothetical protein
MKNIYLLARVVNGTMQYLAASLALSWIFALVIWALRGTSK